MLSTRSTGTRQEQEQSAGAGPEEEREEIFHISFQISHLSFGGGLSRGDERSTATRSMRAAVLNQYQTRSVRALRSVMKSVPPRGSGWVL